MTRPGRPGQAVSAPGSSPYESPGGNSSIAVDVLVEVAGLQHVGDLREHLVDVVREVLDLFESGSQAPAWEPTSFKLCLEI